MYIQLQSLSAVKWLLKIKGPGASSKMLVIPLSLAGLHTPVDHITYSCVNSLSMFLGPKFFLGCRIVYAWPWLSYLFHDQNYWALGLLMEDVILPTGDQSLIFFSVCYSRVKWYLSHYMLKQSDLPFMRKVWSALLYVPWLLMFTMVGFRVLLHCFMKSITWYIFLGFQGFFFPFWYLNPRFFYFCSSWRW